MSFSAGYTVLSNAQAIAAGTPAASTTSGSITSGSGGIISGTVTNPATSPTAPLTVQLQISGDGGTTWFTLETFTAGLLASQTYGFNFVVPEVVTAVRLYYTGNTGETVTVTASLFYAATL
jgi:hypothetical protein